MITTVTPRSFFDRFPSDLDAGYVKDKLLDCECGGQFYESERRECNWCQKEFCEDCIVETNHEWLCKGCLASVTR